MQEPIPFYKDQINSLQTVLIAIKKQLVFTRVLRLLAFLGIAFTIYKGVFGENLWFLASFISTIIFVFLIVKHTELRAKKNLTEAKININKTEIKVLNGEFSDLETGKERFGTAPLYFLEAFADLLAKNLDIPREEIFINKIFTGANMIRIFGNPFKHTKVRKALHGKQIFSVQIEFDRALYLTNFV